MRLVSNKTKYNNPLNQSPIIVLDTAIDAECFVPTSNGAARGHYGITSNSIAAVSGTPVVAFWARKFDGSNRIFVSTSTPAAYELTGTTWTSVDTALLTSYVQFGNRTLAVKASTQEVVQSVTGSFTSAGGTTPTIGPNAMLVVAQNRLGIFNYASAGNDSSYAFARAGTYNDFSTGDTFSGTALQTPGYWRGVTNYKDTVIAWKDRSMYRFTYTGVTNASWRVEAIDTTAGCIGNTSHIVANEILYWADDNGIYRYDGSRPVLISGQIDSIYRRMIAAVSPLTSGIRVSWDENNNLIHWGFLQSSPPPGENGLYVISLNYLTGEFGYTTGSWSPGFVLPVNAPNEWIVTSSFASALQVTSTSNTSHLAFKDSSLSLFDNQLGSNSVQMIFTTETIGNVNNSMLITSIVPIFEFFNDTSSPAITIKVSSNPQMNPETPVDSAWDIARQRVDTKASGEFFRFKFQLPNVASTNQATELMSLIVMTNQSGTRK